MTSLDGIFRPRSVAVVGASRDPLSIGHEIVVNLVAGGFTGPVYPVNPKASVVRSIKCYPSLGKVPDEVDLAVIAVPAPRVPGIVRECGRKGVKGLVVVTAGFRETGPEGAKREAEIVAIAKKHGMRLIGPNCMGVINTEPGISLDASFAATVPMPGSIGFVSQSGALGEAILADAREAGLGIRMFASVGNRADVGAHDLCEYWENDPGVELILLYLESFGDAQRFKAVAERLRGVKPIIAVKSGRSESGARAAGSHTGSVAGTDAAVDTFLMQCGVLRAQSMREMFSFARALRNQPRPKGDGIAVVTNAGGPGILAVDALEGYGLTPAVLGAATRRKLRAALPPEASGQNPIDLIASADADRYRKALRAVVADPNVHALLVLFVSPIMIDAEAVARAILETTRACGKPLVACIMGRQRGNEAKSLLTEAGVPVFRFPEDAAQTLYGMIRYRRLCDMPRGRVRRFEVSGAAAGRILARQRRQGGGWLSARDARRVLEAYGLPLIPMHEVRTETEALAAAHDLGYPVCIKAMAEGLVHKSEHGGVRTGLSSGDEVFAAARDMRERLGARFRDLTLEVQPMAHGHRELLIGMKRDPRIGPMVAVGIGGIMVEVLRDVAVRIGPLTDVDPGQMLDELRGAALLGEFRGQPPIDRAVVEECVLRTAQLAGDFPEITEIDLNPVMAAARGQPTQVVDARIHVSG